MRRLPKSTQSSFLAQIKWGKEVQVLGGLKDTGYRATGGDIMAGRRYLKDQPDLTRRFLMAIAEGISHAQRHRLTNARAPAQGRRAAHSRSAI